MNTAHTILSSYARQEVSEGQVHTHTKAEKADHFKTYGFDPANTEREYIELIHALMRVEKPLRMLETGTGAGIGSLVFAAAMADNEMGGIVTTVDTRYLRGIPVLAEQHGVAAHLSVIQSDALGFIEKIAKARPKVKPFDMAFFDTVQETKGKEAASLLAHQLVAPGGLLIFHDTSEARFEGNENPHAKNDDYLALLTGIVNDYDLIPFQFRNSRGMTIMRFPFAE